MYDTIKKQLDAMLARIRGGERDQSVMIVGGILLVLAILLILPDGEREADIAGQLQAELDSNPFVRDAGLRLRAVAEQNGYVNIDVEVASEAVVDAIEQGEDILRGQCSGCNNPALRHEALVLRNALEVLQDFDGVKSLAIGVNLNAELKRSRLIARANVAYDANNHPAALHYYQQAAELGDSFAQLRSGYLLQSGAGVTHNNEAAIAYYSKAAESGEVQAQFNLGSTYRYGMGVPVDYAAAAKWYQSAADAGYAQAHWALGMMQILGQLGEASTAKAIPHLQKAVELGSINAHNDLTWIYAAAPNAQYHNGALGVELIQVAINDNPDNPTYAGTQAAAFARAGDFNAATEIQQRVVGYYQQLSQQDGGEQHQSALQIARERLELYRSGQPVVDTNIPG